MSKQGRPQFIVAFGDKYYRVRTVEELDCDEDEIRAMFERAKESGTAIKLPCLYQLMSGPQAGANIGDEVHTHTHIHLLTISGANIGDDDHR